VTVVRRGGAAIAFEVTQVGVSGLADHPAHPRPASTALRIELYDARLDHHAASAEADAAPVPAPSSSAAGEGRHHLRTPASGVEAAASLSDPRLPIGVASSTPYRLLDLTDKAGRASTQHTDPARAQPHATTVADLARTDAKAVIIMRHRTTIGGRNAPCKRENAVGVA